jgi:hypothetical protein
VPAKSKIGLILCCLFYNVKWLAWPDPQSPIHSENLTWRIIYRIYTDAILILEIFEKKTNKTPKSIIDICKQRIKRYEKDVKEWEK